jgi:hypothetical protein
MSAWSHLYRGHSRLGTQPERDTAWGSTIGRRFASHRSIRDRSGFSIRSNVSRAARNYQRRPWSLPGPGSIHTHYTVPPCSTLFCRRETGSEGNSHCRSIGKGRRNKRNLDPGRNTFRSRGSIGIGHNWDNPPEPATAEEPHPIRSLRRSIVVRAGAGSAERGFARDHRTECDHPRSSAYSRQTSKSFRLTITCYAVRRPMGGFNSTGSPPPTLSGRAA